MTAKVTVKTSELTRKALNWAVAKCEGAGTPYIGPDGKQHLAVCDYSEDPAQAQAIIEREKISVIFYDKKWRATNGEGVTEEAYTFCPKAWVKKLPFGWELSPGWGDEIGPTPLVAAMRCFVAMRLGSTVRVPKELL